MTRFLRALAVVAWCVALGAPASFASPPPASDAKSLYRIFLQDGTALVSYGEYARVGGRVVFSVPIALDPAPELRLVSIADTAVDWTRTEEYAEAVRARRYAETRGEDDFAVLSNHVAAALNEVAHTKDPARRLALAQEARANLAEWPKRNYGYRAADVTQLLWLFDDVIGQLRTAAGQTGFDLTLYAATAPLTYPDPLPVPDPRATVENAFAAARLAEAGERVSLLEAIAAALAPSGESNGNGWETALRDRALAELAAERQIDMAYAAMAERMLAAADRRVRYADVRGIQGLIASVIAEDDRLGRGRPREATALLAALDSRLDDARRLRLARDAWALRGPTLRRYRRAVEPALAQLRRTTRWLEDIRALAGPAPAALSTIERRMAAVGRTLTRVKAPVEAEGAHGLLATVATMAARAAQTRRTAVQSNAMPVAWEASSAAAGALMMFEQALDEITRLTSPPRSR
jgi:hypothetical protein